MCTRRWKPPTAGFGRMTGASETRVSAASALLTMPAAGAAPRSVRVDLTRGRVVSGLAEGARLCFEKWGKPRCAGTIVAADSAGTVTIRVDNSDATETLNSSALVPLWCAGGVVAKGMRVGFMVAPAGSADGAGSDLDNRNHQQVRCGTVTGIRTTRESGEEHVVIRADDDGAEQVLPVHSLVPSARAEPGGKEGGMTSGEAAVGIVPGIVAVAPISTFEGNTPASGRRVWTVGDGELAGDLNEFNFAVGPLSQAEFALLRDEYCEDVATKRNMVRCVGPFAIVATTTMPISMHSHNRRSHDDHLHHAPTTPRTDNNVAVPPGQQSRISEQQCVTPAKAIPRTITAHTQFNEGPVRSLLLSCWHSADARVLSVAWPAAGRGRHHRSGSLHQHADSAHQDGRSGRRAQRGLERHMLCSCTGWQAGGCQGREPWAGHVPCPCRACTRHGRIRQDVAPAASGAAACCLRSSAPTNGRGCGICVPLRGRDQCRY